MRFHLKAETESSLWTGQKWGSTWRRRQNPVSEPLRFKQATGQWIMSRIVRVILIYRRHKPIERINLLGSKRRRKVFPMRYEYYPPFVINKRQETDNVQNGDSCINVKTYREHYKNKNKFRGFKPAREIYRLSDRRWSANFIANFCVVSAMGPHGLQSRFSRPEPLLFVQIPPHLSSWGWADPVPENL
jgi:hypothetical protein